VFALQSFGGTLQQILRFIVLTSKNLGFLLSNTLAAGNKRNSATACCGRMSFSDFGYDPFRFYNFTSGCSKQPYKIATTELSKYFR